MKRQALPATAVIFCGGRSSRMGRDKAFLDWKGLPLAVHVAERVRPMFRELLVSGDPGKYAAFGFPCIPDCGGAGPLAGLYATLLRSRTPAIFAVACDMPFVSPDAVLALWSHLRGFDAAVPVSAAGAEPLHAFYSKRILPSVGRALGGKSRMVGWWSECSVARVDAHALPGGVEAMKGCDTAEEYERLSGSAMHGKP